MPYSMSTDLGRRVPLEDWVAFHGDRLLSVLFQVAPREFEISEIERVTGLPLARAEQLTDWLLGQRLLECDRQAYKLTSRGDRWVRDLTASSLAGRARGLPVVDAVDDR